MHVERQIADARTEVMRIAPDQYQQDKLAQRIRHPGRNAVERIRRSDAETEQRHDDKRKRKKKQRAADAMEDGRLGRRRQLVTEEYFRNTQISKLRTRF